MQVREEIYNLKTEFSSSLSQAYRWFEESFTGILSSSFEEFWAKEADVKLISISENTCFLSQGEEYFVTKIRLNKELSVFIRLSKVLVRNLLENILGTNGKVFNIEKISELEAKILTGFSNFLYKNFSHLLIPAEELPPNNTNYNECNLTFFLNCSSSGKIVVKIPVVALKPELVQGENEAFDINNYLNTTAEVNLLAGYSRIRLSDLKNLEKDDIVLLENSSSSRMVLRYEGQELDVRVSPNPAIMIDYDIDDGDNSGGNSYMSNIYNMWDTIQVEIGAEFEKVKLTLGELKQISEGLVVDIGSVYDNKIDLKVEDKIVASGELVIINDRYGVKINQIFTEEKNQASIDVQDAQTEYQQYEETVEEEYDEPSYEEAPMENSEVEDEDFDYSDFDVEEDDI